MDGSLIVNLLFLANGIVLGAGVAVLGLWLCEERTPPKERGASWAQARRTAAMMMEAGTLQEVDDLGDPHAWKVVSK